MIELLIITAVASFINISGIEAASDSYAKTAPPRPIITIEDVTSNKPESLLEAIR